MTIKAQPPPVLGVPAIAAAMIALASDRPHIKISLALHNLDPRDLIAAQEWAEKHGLQFEPSEFITKYREPRMQVTIGPTSRVRLYTCGAQHA